VNTVLPLWIIPALPLAGAVVLGSIALASAKSAKGPEEGITGTLAVLFPVLSFLATLVLALALPTGGVFHSTIGTWFEAADVSVKLGFLFDGLSRVMLLFITGIGSLIALYSVGYMHGDRSFARFFAYIELFLFSMIVLVLADSLPLTFLGWEGVGLCSYLLIGFWHKDPENSKAANKAFIVNRVGDVGFLLGMFTIVSLGGSALLGYTDLVAWFSSTAGLSLLADPTGQALIALAALLFFFGCTAKSAQIPLLTWLPDAMAGPTPVSALIHAATMVTSGVYLVARLSPLFVQSPLVLGIITVVGLGTALWAAIAGLVQDDIKKVLAYSTVSQLGFMFMAAGVAAFDVAIFHVFTHAFFKAALFLGAGSVIHALGGEQDLRKMGGLAKKLPATCIIMMLAWAAIIGLPGFAGFWSKDMILERLYVSGPFGPYLYAVAVATAALTAIYMTRLMVLTFFGSYRGDAHAWNHAHESPATMQIPMWVLAVGSVLAGYLWAGLIPGLDLFERVLHPVVGAAQAAFYAGHAEHHVSPWIFALIGTVVAVLGAVAGWTYFGKHTPRPAGKPGPHGFGRAWTFAFDSVHSVVGVWPLRIAAAVAGVVNLLLMTAQWTVAQLPEISADGLKALQQGRVRVQVALSLLGALVLTFVLVWGVR
jgi:NADH-quinone oxidoreductase subunit L